MTTTTEQIQAQLNQAGYDNAIAVATKSEILAKSACGQLSLVIEQGQINN